MNSPPGIDEHRPPKAFSCIRCFEKKVKCDKLNPCSNCVKSKVDCVFRIPPAPRRRRKRAQEDLLIARLRKCEELLKSKGIDIDSPDTQAGTTSGPISRESPSQIQPSPLQFSPETANTNVSTQPEVFDDRKPSLPNKAQLIQDHGKARFIENNLWASLSDEFREPNEAIAEYSEDDDEVGTPIDETTDFLFGHSPAGQSIQHLHPLPNHILILWQMFLDNINPMTKFIHYPTMHKTISQACNQLDSLPRGLEALMFAIYGAAVYSIDDDECEMKLGETRKVLLPRYRHATRRALARAKFLVTSELVVLQALVLYLFSMREEYDARANWILAGVASRIGQGMGLHRDGVVLGLSPFETEMRRRLWWQLLILEGRSAELSGSGRFADSLHMSDNLAPTNVNDEDLYPEMTEPPVGQIRPTEMVSCLLRIELTIFFWDKQREKNSTIDFENLRLTQPWKSSLEERDASMNELERRLEDKFLKYCDPSVPIQFMSIIIGRGAINMMRLMAHHPRKWGPPGEELPPAEREFLWNTSIKLLEGTNMAHSSKQLRRFMWHTRVHFVWQALIFVLNELKKSTLGDQVDRAWQEVDEIYRHHPYYVTDYKKPLHVAVGSLLLKAYAAREAALRESTNGVYPKVIPEYILQLREQRESGPLQRTSANTAAAAGNATVSVTTSASHGAVPLPGEDLATTTTNVGPTSTDEMFTTPSMAWENVLLPTQSQSSTTSTAFSFPLHMSAFHRGPPPATTSTAGTTAQLPLPPFQPISSLSMPSLAVSDGDLFASEPTLVQDLALADVPLDWDQWDYIMRDMGSQGP